MELASPSGEPAQIGLSEATPPLSREALQVANFIRKTGKKQTTRFAGQLEIGSQLKIACKIFTKASVSEYMVCVSVVMVA